MRALLALGAALLAMPALLAGATADDETTTEVVDYPDAITRRLHRMATEPRPVEQSAMPPRHLDEARFPDSLVDRTRIVWGGRAPDEIPAIDDPVFEDAAVVDGLDDREAVLVLELDGRARIYPVRIMVWHEIVNDVVAGVPLAVTYCPLCSSAIAFRRDAGDRVLDFGTSGSLYRSALVLYDRQTESLWTQFDGRAVVGSLVGTTLAAHPVATVSWRDAVAAHPDALVLTTDTGVRRSYGRNPYVGYEGADRPLTGFFTGDIDARLPPMTRVVGVELPDGDAAAIPTAALADTAVHEVEAGGRRIVYWHLAGTASPLDDATVAGGLDIGATGVFDAGPAADAPSFRAVDGGFVDDATGSRWNVLGHAVGGPRTGDRLEPLAHLDTFWFAWSAHRPSTRVLDPTAG